MGVFRREDNLLLADLDIVQDTMCILWKCPLAQGIINWVEPWENVSYVNNKGADQPAPPRSLISAFVFAA